MTGREAYKIWAAAAALWAGWVRPVPFVAMDGPHTQTLSLNLTVPDIAYVAAPQADTALIIDLPGYEGVKEGIALACLGYRPVPLYNGTTGQQGATALVDTGAIESALQWGAAQLQNIPLPADATPAFLLDSNRTHQYKMDASLFDNSWDIYHQDMPSAETFLRRGISRVLVRNEGEKVQKDLAILLYPFQKKGIDILFTDGYTAPKEVRLKKPPRKAI